MPPHGKKSAVEEPSQGHQGVSSTSMRRHLLDLATVAAMMGRDSGKHLLDVHAAAGKRRLSTLPALNSSTHDAPSFRSPRF
jgi:hypothetical protein